MTGPDQAPQPVAEAVAAAAYQLGRVWQLATVQGLREGLEAAAKICNQVATNTRTKPEGVYPRDIPAISTAEFLRDKIREFALDIEDPPPVPFTTEQEKP